MSQLTDFCFDYLPEAALVLDQEDRLVLINQAACQLLDCAPHVVGQLATNVLALWPCLRAALDLETTGQRLLKLGDYWFEIHRSDLPNRQCLILLHNVTDQKQKEGELSEQEITARRQMEDQLSQANQDYNELVSNIPSMVYRFYKCEDGRQGFSYASPRCSELNGVEPQAIIADVNAFFNIIHPDDLPSFHMANRAIGNNFSSFKWEGRLLVNHQVRWVRLESHPKKLKDGTMQWDGIEVDISEQKRLEQAAADASLLLEAAFEQTPIPMVLVSAPDRIFRIVNSAARRFLDIDDEPDCIGLPLQSVLSTWRSFDSQGQPVSYKAMPLERALRGIATQNEEYSVVTKKGRRRWQLISGAPIYNHSGELVAGFIVFPDITERKRLQDAEIRARKLAQSLQEIGIALTSTLDFEQVVDLILYLASRVINIDNISVLLVEGNELTTINSRGFNNPRELKNFRIPIDDRHPHQSVVETRAPVTLSNPQAHYDFFKLSINKNILSWMGVPLIFQNQVIGMLSLGSQNLNNFTEEDEQVAIAFASQVAIALENSLLFRKTERMATIDNLTQLYNRRYFFDLAQKEFERCERYDNMLSIIMVDIDFFKRVNDTYGHAAGDQVLREISAVCVQTMRKIDMVGRYGGEEFVIMLPETPIQEALLAAERLRKNVEELTVIVEETKSPRAKASSHKIRVTISLGVAVCEGAQTLEELLNMADKALYQAKQAGRNCVQS